MNLTLPELWQSNEWLKASDSRYRLNKLLSGIVGNMPLVLLEDMELVFLLSQMYDNET